MPKIDDIINNFNFIKEIFDNIPVGIYICDTDEKVIYVNETAAQIDGLTYEDTINRKIEDLYDTNDSAMRRALETKANVEDSLEIYTVNGREISQIHRGFPIKIDGVIEGACAIEYNIDHFKEALKAQKLLQRRFVNSSEDSDNNFSHIIGSSPAFLNCLSIASLASQRDSSVFLTGSTGTGKEVFAKAIHDSSPRKNEPFLAINCAAIPETLIESILFGTTKGVYTGAVDRRGLFEQAQGGTLFLDELNSMPLSSQAKLLRVLEEKKVSRLGSEKNISFDIRFISSSNVDPRTAIEDKLLREDLYYRLSVINILIPDLADRKNDITLLSDYFLERYNTEFEKNISTISENAKNLLLSYDWPGNVRQLKHCIESAMTFVSEDEAVLTETHLLHFFSNAGVFNASNSPIKTIIKTATQQASTNENTLRSDSHSHISATDHSGNSSANYSDESAPNPVDAPIGGFSKKFDEGDVFKKIEEKEKGSIIAALLETNGNITKTAASLNMSRNALNYRIKKYGIRRK